MSDFVRNLVLRAAGLAPVLEPEAAPAPEVDDADPVVEEIQAVELADPPAEARAAREKELPRSVKRVDSPRAPSREAPAVLTRSSANPTVQPPEVPRLTRQSSQASGPPANNVLQPAAPAIPAEPKPPRATARKERAPVQSRPSIPQHETTEPRITVLEPSLRDEPIHPDVHVVAQPPEKTREIVFVDRPALPPAMLDEVAAVVAKQVPEGPARVEVHIDRIEISAPRQPVPTLKPAPRQPRGFAEHGSERRYVRRRWY